MIESKLTNWKPRIATVDRDSYFDLGGSRQHGVALLQARSRRRGRGGSTLPEIFRLELISATLKWNFATKIDSCQWSIIVRLCTIVLLSNLELCKGTKSYFCSAKNNEQLWNICLLSIKIDRSRMHRNAQIITPELVLLNFIGFLRGPPV